ncbi:MAG: NAD(P)H-dependent oxidoreductase [Bacteroidaceae bacterium]|nr:NAD(P)H-dependent oxidoreductase [Bacteroidaceae bacterium]
MSKILIAYFSRKGENYVNGSLRMLDKGNTEVVVDKIREKLPEADVFRIETVRSYAESYMACIEEAKQELHDDARPELTATVEGMEQYDTVILGYPNWWGTMPMACYTFLERYDFRGKTIIPFCTNEGSGMGSSERAIAKLAPGAKQKRGTSIHGAEAARADSDVDSIVYMAK